LASRASRAPWGGGWRLAFGSGSPMGAEVSRVRADVN
jgi:hypothetical protein